MTAAVAFLALAGLVAAASAWADRLPRGTSWVPVALAALLAAAGAFEAARYDRGHPEVLFGIGWIAAPLVVILGGALWGTRRLYGWPDLGPVPGRAAAVAVALLLGVGAGVRQGARDLEATEATAGRLRADLVAWRESHAGTWPSDLSDAVPAPPRTSMGLLAPPGFSYHARGGRRVLSYPVSGRRARVLDLESGAWTTEDR